MSVYLFLVVLVLTSQFSKSVLLLLNFRQHGTNEALSDLPEEDDNNEFELYFTFTKFEVESKDKLELEETTNQVNWDDAQVMSINLEVYKILVDVQTDPFGFVKSKAGEIGYQHMDMKVLCSIVNQYLRSWDVYDSYVYSLTIEKEDRTNFKIVIETFTAESVGNMAEQLEVTTYEFMEERLILL